MARWRDFLDRFRPAGTPGPAGPHGVPADRAAEASAELLPVLRRLDSIQDEADRLRAEAERRAERIRADGDAQAHALVDNARAAAESVTAETMAAELARAEPPNPADQTAAAAVGDRAQRRLPEYVRRVTDRARADLDALCASDRKSLS
ncbi:hypothetical protein GPX89_14570 [Nocardia sp. ET3-3]|uniref:Uncharacterized protein n=1 Tax=Nocardia terrae TaxID=2675851 RepID=A0A7K1UVV6_9NOCA|nr:hypothetical protein [Nocardia terrae]MVU78465.1 hypothetical protein [Nocardia terrae]